jgi:hypothetical protein
MPQPSKARRPIILLELLIGFALAGILLSFLFSGFRHVADLGQKVHKAKKLVHERAVVHLRLTHLFTHLLTEGEKSFYFAPHEESFYDALFFTFDQKIDPNQDLCGPLKAAIYINNKKELCLSIASKAARRKEVLLKNVPTLSFSFFNPKTQMWEPKWEEEEFPPLLKLHVGKDLTFAFLLPESAKEGL